MKHFIQKKAVGRRFLLHFVTSYSIILMAFLLAGFFLYYIAIHNAEKSIQNESYIVLENTILELDNSYRLMNTLGRQISSNTSFRSLANANETNAQFFMKANDSMKFLTEIMALIDALPITDYFLYLPKTNYMISSSHFSAPDIYYSGEHYIKANYNDWLAMLKSTENIQQFIPLTPYKKDINTYYFKQLLYFGDYTNKEPVILCFEISPEDIRQKFSGLNLQNNNCLFVFNEDDKAVFSITDETEDSSYDINILKVTLKPDFTSEVIRNKRNTYIITKYVSLYNHWTYYLVQENTTVLDQFYTYKNIYIAIIVISVLSILGLFVILFYRYLKPFLQIHTQLETTEQEIETLQSALEQQRPYVYNSYMQRLMAGKISSEADLEEFSSFVGMDFTNKSYGVLYCTISSDSTEINLESLQSEQYIPFFKKYFGSDLCIYKEDIDIFVLLLLYPSEMTHDEYVEIVRKNFAACHESLLNDHKISLYGGFGKRNNRLPYIWESYQQAKEACSYTQENEPFQYHKEINRENNAYYYPLELASQLTNFIKSGNTRQVVEIYKILRRENYDFRTLPPQMARWLLSDIRNTLIKIRYGVEESNINLSLLAGIDQALEDYSTIDKLEETSLAMCELFSANEIGNQLINSIQEYIDKNYTDSSICLKKISDEFHISESYFSYLFKEETKQNFSDYLEYMRMEKALFLVKATQTPLSELYLQLGYNNPNSFRRAFKKVHGASPKAIRDSSQPEQPS